MAELTHGREHEDLYLMMMDLRVWLELEIPLVEDGNSFGALLAPVGDGAGASTDR